MACDPNCAVRRLAESGRGQFPLGVLAGRVTGDVVELCELGGGFQPAPADADALPDASQTCGFLRLAALATQPPVEGGNE